MDRWLSLPEGAAACGDPITVVDDASVSEVRAAVREAAAEIGFSHTQVGELVLLASELSTNQCRHARRGRIVMHRIEREGVPGIEIVAGDRGPGIADPATALAGVPRATGSLGTGLSSVVRFSDEIDLDVRLGEGTMVAARRFLSSVARRREVGIFARACAGERTIGDDAWFSRTSERLRIVLTDGLGHGGDAREAASALIDVARDLESRSPAALLEAAHGALAATRGAVATVVDLDETRGELTHAALGNVVTHHVSAEGTRAFTGPGSVIGMARSKARPQVDREPIFARDLVLLFTDGVSSRARIDVRDDLARAHPVIVAQHLVTTHGRDGDDATVVVAR